LQQLLLQFGGEGQEAAAVRVLLSDEASCYHAAIDELLRHTIQQRSLFHLWRNVLPAIRLYRTAAGWSMAEELIVALQKGWDASSLEQARRLLTKVRHKWRDATVLQAALDLVARTWPRL